MMNNAGLTTELMQLKHEITHLRRTKLFVYACGSLLLAQYAIGLWKPELITAQSTRAVTFDQIRVRQIEIVNGQGEVTAFIGVTTEGDPVIDLRDRSGRPRVELGVSQERNLAALRLLGAGQIEIANERGQVAAIMGLHNGDPVIGLHDRSGRPRVSLGIRNQEKSAGLVIASEDPKVQLSLFTGTNGSGRNISGMGILDRNSRMGWAVRHDTQLGLMERMKDSSGTIRAASHVSHNGDFKYHVQKSALEEIGEVITWVGALRSLIQ